MGLGFGVCWKALLLSQEGHLAKEGFSKPTIGLPMNCFSNLVILLNFVGDDVSSELNAFTFADLSHISHAFYISQCCSVVFAPTAFHSCGGCCLLTAATSSQHPSCADALSSQALGKAKDTVEYPFEFLTKFHLGN